MIIKARTLPINSILLIMDLSNGEIPEWQNDRLVTFSRSCIAVGTLPVVDGETSIAMISGQVCDMKPEMKKIFAGRLITPSRELHVCDVLLRSILKMPLLYTYADVEIWVDSNVEPSDIQIFVESGIV